MHTSSFIRWTLKQGAVALTLHLCIANAAGQQDSRKQQRHYI
jgi:hypothetical protein